MPGSSPPTPSRMPGSRYGRWRCPNQADTGPYLCRGPGRTPFDPAPAATSASDEINPSEAPAPGASSLTPRSRALRGVRRRSISAATTKEAPMGQYHHPVCIEAEEGLSPHTFGVGLKEGEQGFSTPSTPNAMVALVCARGGNMPADCSQSPIIGKWAGKRVLVVGDYAEDGDIPGWNGPRLSTLYRAMTPVEDRRPKRDWKTIPLFRDISHEARDFLEAVCNVRYFEQEQTCRDMVPGSKTYGQITDRWTHTEWVRVEPVAREFGGCGIAEYVIARDYSAEDLAWLKRQGMEPIDVQRPPRSGDWHGITAKEVTEGQRRVIVNLDTLEYIDPARFGQAPTLAGMVGDVPKNRSLPILKKAAKDNGYIVSVASGLFVMLCHP